MAEHPPPPPYEAPAAEAAPPQLVAFLYYLIRDLVPARYIDSVLNHALTNPGVSMDADLKRYADRVARQLTYEPTSGES